MKVIDIIKILDVATLKKGIEFYLVIGFTITGDMKCVNTSVCVCMCAFVLICLISIQLVFFLLDSSSCFTTRHMLSDTRH